MSPPSATAARMQAGTDRRSAAPSTPWGAAARARGNGLSRRMAIGCISCLLVSLAAGWPVPADAEVPTILRIAGSETDIVRMPTLPLPQGREPPARPASPQPPIPLPTTPTPPPAARPGQSLGRLVKVPVRIGTLSSDGQKGWLGVRMDPIELPFALSIGLANANGAIIVEATAAGPAALAGIRFGDVITALDGRNIDSMNDLRQRVLATTPGTDAVLDVWRVSSDDGDFVQTLRKLGDGGNAYIMYRLGRMYATGSGVARDEVEAVRWYRKGSDAGNLNAMAALGIALLDGRGTGKDQQEAVRLLKAATDKDNPDALYRLGVLHANGLDGIVTKDALEAVRLFTKGAEAGHTPAMVDLGLMFNNGQGVQADLVKAAQWYKRAADLGNTNGMVNLGFLHQQGKGVERDDVAAVNLYRRAANEGHPAGIHNLAAMYDSGRGVDRKYPEQAADLMLRALELRNEFSYTQMTQRANNWSGEFRRAMQRKLQEAGFYSGRIDGAFRETTITAINAYINRNR